MTKTISFSNFPLFNNAKKRRHLLDLTLELTARCNNNCRHCYNNLPADDPDAIEKEMTTREIKDIIDQAVDLGTLRILLTGGEVLLREDFFELYTYIKKKGFLVSVFTNATKISQEHIRLFKKYPPWNIEVTVYGASNHTYAKVTRTSNFSFFQRGVDLLLSESIPVTFKAMVIKSNLSDFRQISDFCRDISHSDFRYDPFLTLRTDKHTEKNETIRQERLTADEIVHLEKQDADRIAVLKKSVIHLTNGPSRSHDSKKLFTCGAGIFSGYISYDGLFRLCRPLTHPACESDLKYSTLKSAWEKFVPSVLSLTSPDKNYQETCGKCNIREICMWCPASAYLETGRMDTQVPYFCTLAKKRHENCFEII